MGAPLYVYGLMRGRDAPSALGAGVGDPPGAVCAVAQGGLAALASPVPDGASCSRDDLGPLGRLL